MIAVICCSPIERTTSAKLNATAAANAPGLVSNPFNLRADYRLATYDVRNAAAINAVYTLPFGKGQPFANDVQGWMMRW